MTHLSYDQCVVPTWVMQGGHFPQHFFQCFMLYSSNNKMQNYQSLTAIQDELHVNHSITESSTRGPTMSPTWSKE